MRKAILCLSFVLSSGFCHGLTEGETWADTEWNTTWVDVAGSGACDTTDTFAYATTDGNPTFCRNRTCVGRNDTSVRISSWTGTWEDLGVTAGGVVSTIQMLDLDTKYLTDTVCDSVTFGPFELRTSTGGLVDTLWAGRTATTVESSFTAEGAQTAVSVGDLSASDAEINLWMNTTGDTGNNASATCVGIIDNLDIEIVYTAGGTRRVIVIGSARSKNTGDSS